MKKTAHVEEMWLLDFAGLSQHDITNLLSSASSTGETLLPLMQTASFLLRHVNDGGNLVTANGIEVVEMADGVWASAVIMASLRKMLPVLLIHLVMARSSVSELKPHVPFLDFSPALEYRC